MIKTNFIGLHLKVYDRAWFIIEKGCVPHVDGAFEVGRILTDEKDAKKAIANGYKIIEVDWCKFQTMLSDMRAKE